MDATEIEPLFTRSGGDYVFARWGRPIAPVVFGVDDATLAVVKGAVSVLCELAHHPMTEMDPELGVNFMVFFLRDWEELRHVPDLDRLIEGLGPLLDRLEGASANQYRVFRFDESGAIRASFVFVRMDAEMSGVPAETLALSQVAQSILLWSDTAFIDRSPLARTPGGAIVLHPDIGAVIRAGYDPVLPPVARDPSHALRLSARVTPPT